jgi:hypothetical protein
LRLSAELRNNIYQLVFTIGVVTVHDPSEHYHNTAAGARGALALLQTCRQINDKATPLFFSTITFSLQRCALQEFGKMIGPDKVALVMSLIVDLVDAYVWEYCKAGWWNHNLIGELSALENLHLVEPYLQYLPKD